MSSRFVRWYVVVAGTISLVLMSFVVLAPLSVEVWRTYASTTWPAVSGMVLESHVTQDSKGRSHANVRYSYSVSGVAYEGRTIQFAQEYQGESQAMSIVQRFPSGAVLVYYNPGNPHDSALQPGGEPTIIWFMLGIGAVIAGAFLILIVLLATGRIVIGPVTWR